MRNLIEESHGIRDGVKLSTTEVIARFESYRARIHEADSGDEPDASRTLRAALAVAEPGDKNELFLYLAKVATTDFGTPSWEASELLADDPSCQTTLDQVIEELRRKGASIALAKIEDRRRRRHGP
jgi:hypothetical protein